MIIFWCCFCGEVFHKATVQKVGRLFLSGICRCFVLRKKTLPFARGPFDCLLGGEAVALLGACLFLELFFVLFHPSPSANSEVGSSIIIFLTSSPVCL